MRKPPISKNGIEGDQVRFDIGGIRGDFILKNKRLYINRWKSRK